MTDKGIKIMIDALKWGGVHTAVVDGTQDI